MPNCQGFDQITIQAKNLITDQLRLRTIELNIFRLSVGIKLKSKLLPGEIKV